MVNTFARTPSAIWNDIRSSRTVNGETLTGIDASVYTALDRHVRYVSNSVVSVSQKELASSLACSVNTVRSSVRRLERFGHIKVHRGSPQSYELVHAESCDAQELRDYLHEVQLMDLCRPENIPDIRVMRDLGWPRDKVRARRSKGE